MAAKRKTIARETIVANLNKALAQRGTWQLTAEQRQALSTFTEALLFDMNDYRGFGYQREEMSFSPDGSEFLGLRRDADDTRRIYY